MLNGDRVRSHPVDTILVHGATGNVGFSALKALKKESHLMPYNLKAGIHDLSKLNKVMELGPEIDIAQLDTEFPQTVHSALQGVIKLVVCPPSTEDRVEASKLMIQAAMDTSTIKHIVLVSLIGADRCATDAQKQFHCIEQFLERSGVPFTIMRCALFMENFCPFATHLVEGKLRLPLHAGHAAMVALRDVGECIATVLTSRESVHYHKCYNITGPELLDGNGMAARLSEGLSIPIQYVDITDTEAHTMFTNMKLTPWKASGLVATFSQLALGGSEHTYQDSKLLLGYQPTTLSIWARDNYLSIVDRAQQEKKTTHLPPDAVNQATNEQGQSTTNEQGQQGAATGSWEGSAKAYEHRYAGGATPPYPTIM